MSECLHCDIHELLDSQLEGKEANLAEIAAKVTEVLADIILMAPPEDQSTVMADILANLGSFVLEKKEDAEPTKPRRSSHCDRPVARESYQQMIQPVALISNIP